MSKNKKNKNLLSEILPKSNNEDIDKFTHETIEGENIEMSTDINNDETTETHVDVNMKEMSEGAEEEIIKNKRKVSELSVTEYRYYRNTGKIPEQ